jgi:tyrosinase
MSGAAPTATAPLRALRHRRDARKLTAGQLTDLRSAIHEAQQISASDDRSYQSWAGIHGLPLPVYCKHSSNLFLPWHRAYLYFFEKELQDRVAGVTLPWWDWTGHHAEGMPGSYTARRAGRRRNPLFDSPIQPSGRRNRRQTRTVRQPGPSQLLPSPNELTQVMRNPDYFGFQAQLEGIHNRIHGWVGGTMNDPYTAAYDPVFWAHHTMIDRCWYLWQLRNPGAGPPSRQLDQALPPFAMTVRQTLDITQLGYDYAATTAAVNGPGHG